ncbi:ELMO domain-containing protein [Haematococcus lacustris]|uniref:ELMO domain-containing protein n=1 Tax=Haematococcus lacustris TaxID=44745 RepID=A0A6A0AB38_HAELA|nr:ELMO domain-containing protein [Haematococcus lacustris]
MKAIDDIHLELAGPSAPLSAIKASAAAPRDANEQSCIPQVAFEGQGMLESGTARRGTDAYDDEFDYAFAGEQRHGAFHNPVFKAAPLPTHLVTNVKQPLQGQCVEEGDEEEDTEDVPGARSSQSRARSPGTPLTDAPESMVVEELQADSLSCDLAQAEAALSGFSGMPGEYDALSSAGFTVSGMSENGRSYGIEHEGLARGNPAFSSAASGSQASQTRLDCMHMDTARAHSASPDVLQQQGLSGLSPGQWTAAVPAQPRCTSASPQNGSAAAGAVAKQVLQQTAGMSAAAAGAHLAMQRHSHSPGEELPSVKLLKSLPAKHTMPVGHGWPGGSDAMLREPGLQLLQRAGGHHSMPAGLAAGLAPGASRLSYSESVAAGSTTQPGLASSPLDRAAGHTATQVMLLGQLSVGALRSQGSWLGSRPPSLTQTSQPTNLGDAAPVGLDPHAAIQRSVAHAHTHTRPAGQGVTGSAGSLTQPLLASPHHPLLQPGPASDAAPMGAAQPPSQPGLSAARVPAPENDSAAQEEEWEAANRRLLQQPAAGPDADSSHWVVSYPAALLHLMAAEPDPQTRSAVTAGITTRPTSLLTRLFCLGPKPLSQLLAEQQVRLLALARVPFSEEDPMHFRLLASIYANLTGKAGQQPARTGQHWAELGFQGMDPATDLRGCGILGLLQIAYLYEHHAASAGCLLRLAQSSSNEFPLAVVSLNVTKFVLQASRNGIRWWHDTERPCAPALPEVMPACRRCVRGASTARPAAWAAWWRPPTACMLGPCSGSTAPGGVATRPCLSQSRVCDEGAGGAVPQQGCSSGKGLRGPLELRW